MLTIAFLPHQLPDFIVAHADFDPACQDGAECFMEFEGGLTLDDVQGEIVQNVCRRYDGGEAFCGVTSLPDRAGFCLGWLSALACVSPDLVLSGLDLLSTLVRVGYQEEVNHGFNPLVAVPGLVETL